MAIRNQTIALYTLVRHEMVRMFRIATQVFLPPVITTALYFLIFGNLIGNRIGLIDDVPYTLFIAPGLIMMSVITNSYGNVSTSLFSMRFQKSIEELLVSPMRNGLLLMGYILGGMLRGLLVAVLVFLVSYFFIKIEIQHLGLTLLVILFVSAIFALAGFTNAIVARNFDDVMIVPTFVLAPLTYLGGVFYTINMLPPFWQMVSQFNPFLYMVNLLRYAMLGQQQGVNLALAIGILIAMLVMLVILNLIFLKKGVGLRE